MSTKFVSMLYFIAIWKSWSQSRRFAASVSK